MVQRDEDHMDSAMATVEDNGSLFLKKKKRKKKEETGLERGIKDIEDKIGW